MKCPNCGTTNGKTNKFCRECGAKVEGVTEVIGESVLESHAETICALDDVALGEELFGVMRLYENGDLEAASGRINHIIACSPESASAHSIKALICERKADLEAAQGNMEICNGYLMAAIAEYEAIIDLNPDSGADREKLVMLRMKMAGKTPVQNLMPVRPVSVPSIPFSIRLKEYAGNVPAPVLASGATLVVLAVLLSVLMPRSATPKPSANLNVVPQPRVNQVAATMPTTGYTNTATNTNTYSYPAPAPAPIPPAPMPQPQAAVPQTPTTSAVEPIKLPPFKPEFVLVPEPKRNGSEPKPKPSASVDSTPKIKVTMGEVPDESSNTPDGSSLLNRAITLSNQGRYSEAIQTAQQAVGIFQGDLAAGRNTTVAQRGIDTTNKYIQLWKSM